MARKHGKDRGILEYPKGSGQWWVRLFVNGREKRYRCDNKTQAKALYGRLRAEIREKKFFPEQFKPSRDITLRAWIDRYLEGITHVKSYTNQKRYGKWWKLILGKRLLPDITVEDIARLQAKAIKKGNRSPQTINRYLAFLKHVLNLAIKDDLISRNPVSSVKFYPEPRGRLRFLTDEEINKLKGKMTPEDFAMAEFALNTGLRRSEQFTLKWSHIDQENRVLTIPRSKSGETRHVPLNDKALEILKGLNSWLTSPWVFPSQNPSTPIDDHNFYRRIFVPALEDAKIEGVVWHTLRHTFASKLVMAGVDIRTVQELMGHKEISMTLRYSHLSQGHLNAAVQKLVKPSKAKPEDKEEISAGTVTKTVTEEVEGKSEDTQVIEKIGAPGPNRTVDPQLRRLLLYPTELQAH